MLDILHNLGHQFTSYHHQYYYCVAETVTSARGLARTVSAEATIRATTSAIICELLNDSNKFGVNMGNTEPFIKLFAGVTK